MNKCGADASTVNRQHNNILIHLALNYYHPVYVLICWFSSDFN